jgi:F420-non-reducing hydrogenase iron-sulfur subunit
MNSEFEPKIMGFLCNWCSYAGADSAGIARFQYPPNLSIMRTMCTGRVDPMFILKALQRGYDGVLVFGCHPGDCHYLEGNIYAAKRIEMVRYLLEISGLDEDRLHLRYVSATEGQQFAEYVKELTNLLSSETLRGFTTTPVNPIFNKSAIIGTSGKPLETMAFT